ncbi:MAG TPA: glycine cleavage T C-terminal barrel domain-containing protein [Vicinamibacterales bacterium]
MKQDSSNGYAALRSGVGLVDRSHLGRLLLAGADRRVYLQGLLTNDIEALTPGTGCYAALLTAQGRMITDMRVVELGDAVLVDLPAALTEQVRAHFERFVFGEDVQVRDVTGERAEIGVYGPASVALLQRVLQSSADLASLPLFGCLSLTHDNRQVIVIRSDEAGVEGFDLVVESAGVDALTATLRAAGAIDVDAEAAEAVRIESGHPRFEIDMTTDTIPLEAGIEDLAISRTKGCYVGQEVIVRVLDRGQGRVARRLVGLVLGSHVPRGTRISAAERDIGWITSVAHSPTLGQWIALGYVQRDYTAPGTHVAVGGTTGSVSELPFV